MPEKQCGRTACSSSDPVPRWSPHCCLHHESKQVQLCCSWVCLPWCVIKWVAVSCRATPQWTCSCQKAARSLMLLPRNTIKSGSEDHGVGMHGQTSSPSALSKGRPLPPGSCWGLGCTEGHEVSGSIQALQALHKKVVPQFVFKTHQPTGKVHPQCQLGPTGGISWHQPARSTPELQKSLEQPDAATQKPTRSPGSDQSEQTAAEGALGPAVMLPCCPTGVLVTRDCVAATLGADRQVSHSPSAVRLLLWLQEATAGHELSECGEREQPAHLSPPGTGDFLPNPPGEGSLPWDPDGARSRGWDISRQCPARSWET